MSKKVIVIGGGIGGLVAARALGQQGIEVELYEQAPEIRPMGAGLSLWVNAVRMLERVGLGEPLCDIGAPIETLQIRTRAGAVLSEVSVGALAHSLESVNLIVHRGDLQHLLVQALDPGVLRLGAPCVGFEQDAEGVTVQLANGRTARGDLLVGADGFRSVVRRGLLGDEGARFAGYVAWLGVAQRDEPRLAPRVGFESWGRGTRVGMFQLRGGRVYWYALRNSGDRTPGVTPGKKEDVLEFVQGWHEPVADVVRATADEAIVRLGIYDRAPAPRWGEGRVTLLGDAAHPMTPNLGQGACQAIEDAVTLATFLAEAGSTEGAAALRRYETRRMARTSRMVNQSRVAGQIAHLSNPLGTRLRDSLYRLVPAPLLARQYGALFRYEP